MTAPTRSSRVRYGVVLLALLVAVAVVGLAGLTLGGRTVPPGAVLDALAGRGLPVDVTVVRDLRVPRSALGLVVGAALGASGALMQALTRNPLADPGVLGINAGAAAAVVAAIALLGVTTTGGQVWFAFVGAAAVAVAVSLLGSRGSGAATPVRLALAGTALAAALSSAVYAAVLLDPATFDAYRSWRLGSLAGRDLVVLVQIAPFVAVGLLLTLALARNLDALALGEDTSRALGTSPTGVRVVTGLAVVLLCGAATAAVGPIAFAGLAVPHLVRAAVGPGHTRVLPCSMLLGAVLVLGADVLGRVLGAPGELEVGVVVAFLGAPVFVVVARRRRLTS